ncbi:FAD-binding domain-containing protein [Amylostereum chailletii]|nr:FAD-binding domain-containing protein [Amylostereum chailletii]
MTSIVDLQNVFKGDIVTPEHPEYDQALVRWAANSQRRAAVVAFVRDTEDVSAALAYAKAKGLPIAVRGGGHNPAGAASVEGGLVIDLSRYFAGVRVDAEKKLAYAGGGALWGTVNTETMKHGLATTGGTVSHVDRRWRASGLYCCLEPAASDDLTSTFALVRLTLGGGFGYLAGTHGLTIDNLVQATVVLANGTVLTADSTENADLFWGIRGGGANFGVVTEFVYQLHPQRPTVYAGVLVFPPPTLDALIPIVEKKSSDGLDPKETFMLVASKLPNGMPGLLLLLFWNGSEEEGRAHFKPFFDLRPIMDMSKEMPYEIVNTLLDHENPVGSNYYLKSVSQPRIDVGIAKRVRDAVYELSDKNPGFSISYIFEFWNLSKINSVPNDAMAFQRGVRLSSLANIKYPENTPEQLAIARDVAQTLTGIIASMDDNAPADVNTGYANYNSDAPALVDAINSTDELMSEKKTEALFGTNLAMLQEIKKKYDPDLVFRKWFAIVPTTTV